MVLMCANECCLASTFGVLLNHYATQSAFAAAQLNNEWESVLRAARLLKDDAQ